MYLLHFSWQNFEKFSWFWYIWEGPAYCGSATTVLMVLCGTTNHSVSYGNQAINQPFSVSSTLVSKYKFLREFLPYFPPWWTVTWRYNQNKLFVPKLLCINVFVTTIQTDYNMCSRYLLLCILRVISHKTTLFLIALWE